MSDTVAALLRQSPLVNKQRADLWDAYDNAHDEDALASVLSGMQVPKTVKARLWDLKAAKAESGDLSEPKNPDKGTLNEELHTPPIGIDPRMEPESMMNEAQTREVPGDILGGYSNYAALATAPTMMRGGAAIASGAARSRLRPIITGAAIGGGTAVLTGGDVTKGAIEGAVIGAAGGGMGASAAAGRTAAKTAAGTVATEAAPDAAALLKIARSGSVTTAERNAARIALQRMGWVPQAEKAAAEAVTEVPTPVVRKAIKKLGDMGTMPEAGNVKPATVFTKPNPVQGAKPLTEMQIVTRGRQAEAAEAAGLNLGEMFGTQAAPTTTKAVSKGAQAVAQHKAFMTFGKEIATRNPKVGEKIWMLLDESGNPVKELTPGEAGAAARKGLPTTWVKNLWTN